MIYPTKNNRITSKFGYRKRAGKQDFHGGIDYGPIKPGVKGDPIYVIANGTVKHVGNDVDGWGLYIIVEHLSHCTIYCHCCQINVEDEQTVKEGHIIGLMGNTGDSDGVHLHHEVREGLYSKTWTRWEDITSNGNREYVNAIDPEYFYLRFMEKEPVDESALFLENVELKNTLDNINKISERN